MHDGSELVAGVRVGEILADKYRIERVLGVGGMGIVVAAYHVHLDERVAIKFLLPEALMQPDVVARFAREARAAVKIKSEHVARVIDVGTLASGSPYMVMEYLDGCDLSARLEQRGVLAIEQAVEFVLQACEAIADAHGLGIVHRDLKPANLFCIRRSDGLESIKVLDFGISKVKNAFGSTPDLQLTRTTAVFGSPLYMSPEQLLSSRDVDSRTDIWALGTILHELLTGKSPFIGETLQEVSARISSQPPMPLREFRPDVPAGLEAVVQKCLEKDRTNRYLNIAELAIALAPFGPKRARSSVERISRIIQASGLSASAVALPPSSGQETQLSGVSTSAAWGNTAPEPSRFSVKKVLSVIVGVTVFGIAAVGFYLSRKPAATPSNATTVPVVTALAAQPSVEAPTSVNSAPLAPPVASSAGPAVAPITATPVSVLPQKKVATTQVVASPTKPPAPARQPRATAHSNDDFLSRQH